MARSLALGLVFVLVATVSARDVTRATEAEYLASHVAGVKVPANVQTNVVNMTYPCQYCEAVLAFVSGMATDPTLVNAITAYMETTGCTFGSPAPLRKYCIDFAKEIPVMVKAFADDYLGPSDCAPLCKAPPMSHQELAQMIAKLVFGLQQNQDVQFPCLYCENVMKFVHNLTTDEALLTAIVNYTDGLACIYMVPEGFKTYCQAYVSKIPAMVKEFVNTYLNPTEICASVCSPRGMDQKPNFLSTVAQRAPSKTSSK